MRGHSRDWASTFKSKVLSPAHSTAHPGPPHSTLPGPRSISPCHASRPCQCCSQPGTLLRAFPTWPELTPSLTRGLLLGNPGAFHEFPCHPRLCQSHKGHQTQLSMTRSPRAISVFPTLGTTPGTQQVLHKCMLQARCRNTEKPLMCMEEAARGGSGCISSLCPHSPLCRRLHLGRKREQQAGTGGQAPLSLHSVLPGHRHTA